MDDLYNNLDSFDRFRLRHEISNLGTDKLLWTCVCNIQFFTDRTMVRSVLLYNGDINRELLEKFLGPTVRHIAEA